MGKLPYVVIFNSRGQRIGTRPLIRTPADQAARLAELERQVARDRLRLQSPPARPPRR